MHEKKRSIAGLADLADLDGLRQPRQPAVLIVEDEPLVAAKLRDLISLHASSLPSPRSGSAWTIDHADTLASAHAQLLARPYDLLVVDRGMTDGDGVDFVAEQRKAGLRTPALMLTQFSKPDEEVAGLQGGADDYVFKTTDTRILLARIARLTQPLREDKRLLLGWLEIDFAGRGMARYAGRELDLRPGELRLLAYLAIKAPEIATREELARKVWRKPCPEPRKPQASEKSGRSHKPEKPLKGEAIRDALQDVRINSLRNSLRKEGGIRFAIASVRGNRKRGESSGWKLEGPDVTPQLEGEA